MIAIIDYDAGNLASVFRAVSHLGYSCAITKDVKEIQAAQRIIFPGVGAAGAAMESLRRSGLDVVIKEAFAEGKPILGICLGSQIILAHSEENATSCLVGWNGIRTEKSHPLLSGLGADDEFYFVHSYYPDPQDAETVIAVTDYGISFASIVGLKNLFATQFHLEKSGRPGLKILDNFCKWTP
jgi:glutamine amidotransferase